MKNLNRRGFLAAVAAAFVVDPEKLLWRPGTKLISIPKPKRRLLYHFQGVKYFQTRGNHGQLMNYLVCYEETKSGIVEHRLPNDPKQALEFLSNFDFPQYLNFGRSSAFEIRDPTGEIPANHTAVIISRPQYQTVSLLYTPYNKDGSASDPLASSGSLKAPITESARTTDD